MLLHIDWLKVRATRRFAVVPHRAMAVFEPGNSHQMAVVLEEKTLF
jgi:hypothetical protein